MCHIKQGEGPADCMHTTDKPESIPRSQGIDVLNDRIIKTDKYLTNLHTVIQRLKAHMKVKERMLDYLEHNVRVVCNQRGVKFPMEKWVPPEGRLKSHELRNIRESRGLLLMRHRGGGSRDGYEDYDATSPEQQRTDALTMSTEGAAFFLDELAVRLGKLQHDLAGCGEALSLLYASEGFRYVEVTPSYYGYPLRGKEEDALGLGVGPEHSRFMHRQLDRITLNSRDMVEFAQGVLYALDEVTRVALGQWASFRTWHSLVRDNETFRVIDGLQERDDDNEPLIEGLQESDGWGVVDKFPPMHSLPPIGPAAWEPESSTTRHSFQVSPEGAREEWDEDSYPAVAGQGLGASWAAWRQPCHRRYGLLR